ncbi:MAG: hypothetical protein ACRC1M_08400 [Methanobacteriaceae archaeon]
MTHESHQEVINYALAIKEYDIKLDSDKLYYKEYDKFTVEYDSEMSGYTLKFNDTNLIITKLNTYEIEEELHKRDFSNDELLDFFLWMEINGLNLIETELFMHNMELIPEDVKKWAEESTNSFLTTGTSTTFRNQRIDEIFEEAGLSDYIISKK